MSDDGNETKRPAGPRPKRKRPPAHGHKGPRQEKSEEPLPPVDEGQEEFLSGSPPTEEVQAPGNEQPLRVGPRPSSVEPGEEFSLQVLFDRVSKQFTASIIEFPDVRVSGMNRETVIKELQVKLEDKLLLMKQRGEAIPEPLGTKRYPESLEVRLSQGLFRKLDVLSRFERQNIENLVPDLLNAAVERRYEHFSGIRGPQPKAPPPQPHNQRHDRGQRQGGGGGGGRMSQRNYANTMQSRESFMEYVRNLEKGNWKKR